MSPPPPPAAGPEEPDSGPPEPIAPPAPVCLHPWDRAIRAGLSLAADALLHPAAITAVQLRAPAPPQSAASPLLKRRAPPFVSPAVARPTFLLYAGDPSSGDLVKSSGLPHVRRRVTVPAISSGNMQIWI